jgi:hypothetical protein
VAAPKDWWSPLRCHHVIMVAMSRGAACLAFPMILAACTGTSTNLSPSPTPSVERTCALVLPPSPSVRSGILQGVAVLSSSDAWAVGGYRRSGVGPQNLIEHWDGARWSQVKAPDEGSDSLSAISAVSSDDAWAVGGTEGFQGDSLIERWDGSSWSIVQIPHIEHADYLTSVSADSPTDAWAVGAHWVGGITGGGHYSTLVEHWNGARWKIIKTPEVAALTNLTLSAESTSLLSLRFATEDQIRTYSVEVGDNILTSVDALSPSNVWAAGAFFLAGHQHLLVEHWDGRSWSVKDVGPGTFTSIRVISKTVVWGLGNTNPRVGSRSSLHPFVDRWDGSGWNRASLPPAGPAAISGSVDISPSNVWAVGQTQGSRPGPLVDHWDGHRWSVVAVPTSRANLYAIAADPTGWVVAVGQETRTPAQPVIVQSC